MKNFKPLALSAAVATATAGYVGVANAQIDAGNLGDLAIVPYYTVQDEWITGIHITNTTEATQVVKLRFRRGSDSMDALDFNIILSPKDGWSGFIKGDDEDSVVVSTPDNSCTAPWIPSGQFPMPVPGDATDVAFNEGAMEGYVEIIAMAQPDSETAPIAVAALHERNGVLESSDGYDNHPADCVAVESNFFRNATEADPDGDPTKKGVLSSSLTHQEQADGTLAPNNYVDSPAGALAVSYFIRNQETGVEMGSAAIHINSFGTEAMMSNQAKLVGGTFDPWGFYYPDLDGGSPTDTARGLYDSIVRPALAVEKVINDWSVGTAERGINTDWVLTLPGQYLMVDFANYVASLNDPNAPCLVDLCDRRDIPAKVTAYIWDREEDNTVIETPEDGLVISPGTGTPDPVPTTTLPNEVNVFTWDNTGASFEDVPGAFNSMYRQNVGLNPETEAGWSELSVEADAGKAAQGVWLQTATATGSFTDVTTTQVPMVGFTGWRRVLPDQPTAEYGRLIPHAFVVSSS